MNFRADLFINRRVSDIARSIYLQLILSIGLLLSSGLAARPVPVHEHASAVVNSSAESTKFVVARAVFSSAKLERPGPPNERFKKFVGTDMAREVFAVFQSGTKIAYPQDVVAGIRVHPVCFYRARAPPLASQLAHLIKT